MKENTCIRMGYLKMGLFLAILTALFLGSILALASTVESAEENINDAGDASGSTRQDDDDTIYIYETREISDEDEPIQDSMVINGSGEFIISNSVTITFVQEFSYQHQITIKDNGTLHLRKGNLDSTHGILIYLQDNGKILLEQDSILKVDKILTNDNSVIESHSSTISKGVSGLALEIAEESELNLIDGSEVIADNINTTGNSKILIENSLINSRRFSISCKDLTLSLNKDYRDLKIDSCVNLYIKKSNINNLEIVTGNNLQVTQESKLENSKIVKIDTINIENSEIKDVDVILLENDFKIQNSDVSNLNILNCKKFEIYNTDLNNSELQIFADEVEISESTVSQSSILGKKINIHNSNIDCTTEQLEVLGRANILKAYNSSFNLPLPVSGTSEIHLINCYTIGSTHPIVDVHNDAVVKIYWWLDVTVLDEDSKPLKDAVVSVFDFWENDKIDERTSDISGKVKFKLLANTINEKGWDSIKNKSYLLKGRFNDKTTENGSRILMKENKMSYLEFVDVIEPKKDEEKPLLTLEVMVGILIFIIVIILISLAILSRNKEDRRDRTSQRRASRIKDEEEAEEPEPRHKPKTRPRAGGGAGPGPRARARPPGRRFDTNGEPGSSPGRAQKPIRKQMGHQGKWSDQDQTQRRTRRND